MGQPNYKFYIIIFCFQAIYFFENSFNFGSQVKSASSSPRKGQQSLMSFGFVKKEASINLTAEQFRYSNGWELPLNGQ